MTKEELKGHIYRNSISNYIFLVVRLGLGVVLFRLLFKGLTDEEFGFWGLLWSVFGYGILLDFGFGFTAQKRVAELSATKDWDQLSRVLSTIFFSYLGIAALLVLIGITIAAVIYLEIHQPKPVVLYEMVKGRVTSAQPDVGETHHVER